MNTHILTLYDRMMTAERIFTAELVRVYGRNACNARYRYRWTHRDAGVGAASDARDAAIAAYRAACREAA
jgi:hypothetical protein